MKILQVCPRYYPYIGGVEQHVKNISEKLVKNYDVTVFTTDPSGKLPKEEEINGIKVKRFKCFAPNEAYYFSPRMFAELRKTESQIVHGHNYHAFPLFFSQYVKKKKLILTPHYHGVGHTFIRNSLINLYKPFVKKVFEVANNIICVSRYEKNLLLNDFKIEEKKIAVIPNGINEKEFLDLKKTQKNYRMILHVSRIEKLKGIDYLIKVLPKLDHDIILEIVGDGNYRKKLEKLINRMDLKNRIIIHRNLSRNKLLNTYADADLFVLLSKYEAFGISVAEALASKTPCIVANSSALQEWIDNKNCFGIKYPVNINELGCLINEIIGKEIQGVKLFDWNDVSRELVKIYEDCQQE